MREMQDESETEDTNFESFSPIHFDDNFGNFRCVSHANFDVSTTGNRQTSCFCVFCCSQKFFSTLAHGEMCRSARCTKMKYRYFFTFFIHYGKREKLLASLWDERVGRTSES